MRNPTPLLLLATLLGVGLPLHADQPVPTIEDQGRAALHSIQAESLAALRRAADDRFAHVAEVLQLRSGAPYREARVADHRPENLVVLPFAAKTR